jgi:hypothetical protein
VLLPTNSGLFEAIQDQKSQSAKEKNICAQLNKLGGHGLWTEVETFLEVIWINEAIKKD